MNLKNLKLKTIDKKIEYEFKNAHIFALDYFKKIKNNEFHSPEASRVIIETTSSVFNFLLDQSFIISDKEGNITILTNATYKQVIQKEKYFNEQDVEKSILLKNIYDNKQELGLLPKEIIEKYWATKIYNLNFVLKIKIPHQIGGGF